MVKFLMNPPTGTIDTSEGWLPYTEQDGLIEVVQNKDGEWVKSD